MAKGRNARQSNQSNPTKRIGIQLHAPYFDQLFIDP